MYRDGGGQTENEGERGRERKKIAVCVMGRICVGVMTGTQGTDAGSCSPRVKTRGQPGDLQLRLGAWVTRCARIHQSLPLIHALAVSVAHSRCVDLSFLFLFIRSSLEGNMVPCTERD